MKVTPITSAERGRFGLKVPKVEPLEFKKVKEFPRQESEERLWDEFSKQVGKEAVRTAAVQDEQEQPAPGHLLDRRV